MRRLAAAGLGTVALLFTLGISCRPSRSAPREVVVYAAVDQTHAEPVLRLFEAETGIRVRALYDAEAAKTVGLVNRLLAEQPAPRADVFWSGEFAHTVKLKEKGVLSPYASPQAADIPAAYRDPDACWTGFGGRARVLIVNRNLVPAASPPSRLEDLLNEAYPADQVGLALPLFGTTSTQAAALYARLGPDAALAFFEKVQKRGVKIVDGNATVRDMVADGRLWFGLTDTDDAAAALQRGAPVSVVFPDQEEGGLGTLVIPNTVAVLERAPHPAEARAVVDFLLSQRVEELLTRSGWFHVQLRPGSAQPGPFDTSRLRAMDVSLPQVTAQIGKAQDDLRRLFVR